MAAPVNNLVSASGEREAQMKTARIPVLGMAVALSVGLRAVAVVLAGCVGLACSAAAQSYPVRPITLIAPSSPGGPVDLTARIIAPPLAKILGQPVVVENRPGASQKIGIQTLLRAPRNGYTFSVVAMASMIINPLIDRNVGYDPLKDFTLLTLAVETFSVLVVHPSLPVKSMREFVAYGRANPGKLTFGSGGNRSRINFSTQDLLLRLGIKAVHVPYKAEPPALADLVSGQINMMMPPAGSVKGFVDSGKLVALGTDGAKRWDQLPNVSTIAEAGIAELKGPIFSSWFGYAAAAGIPADAAAVLQNALVTALRTAEIRDSFAAAGFEVVASTPQEFSAAIAAELERNRKVIESGAFTVE